VSVCSLLMSSYPRKSREFLHRAHCYVPAALAAILDESPQFVAPIVHAFYHRDPLDLKVVIQSFYCLLSREFNFCCYCKHVELDVVLNVVSDCFAHLSPCHLLRLAPADFIDLDVWLLL